MCEIRQYSGDFPLNGGYPEIIRLSGREHWRIMQLTDANFALQAFYCIPFIG